MINIVMSAYNAAKTINKAIDSVLNQTYKDIKLVIVNDCSVDNTEDIVLSYNDPRIIYVKNETNVGCGKTRQVGIDHIEDSDYMCFLDSDDYLKDDFLEILYNKAVKYNADFITSGNIFVTNGIEEMVAPKYERIMTGLGRFEYDSRVSNLLTGAFIKTDLWKHVSYSEERFMEDTITIIKLIYYCERRLFSTYCGYYYTQNANSLVHTCSPFKMAMHRIINMYEYIKFFADKEINTSDLKIRLYHSLNDLNGMEIEEEEYELYRDRLGEIMEYSDSLVFT